jgi:transposase-like protein
MAVEAVWCPHCQSGEVVKYGTTTNGRARFRCQKGDKCGRTFIREYAYRGRVPQVKRQMVEMTLNGSGVPDIARGHCQLARLPPRVSKLPHEHTARRHNI